MSEANLAIVLGPTEVALGCRLSLASENTSFGNERKDLYNLICKWVLLVYKRLHMQTFSVIIQGSYTFVKWKFKDFQGHKNSFSMP